MYPGQGQACRGDSFTMSMTTMSKSVRAVSLPMAKPLHVAGYGGGEGLKAIGYLSL